MSPTDHMSGESRADAVIVDYLERIDHGEHVDRDELLRTHPELADELRDFFNDADNVSAVLAAESTNYSVDGESTEGFLPRSAHAESQVDEPQHDHAAGEVPEAPGSEDPSILEFVRTLVESKLMSQQNVDDFQKNLAAEDKPKTAEELAKALYRGRKLTKFQTQAVFQGRTKGLVLGNYVVLDKIGQGGMGHVYKARHTRMKREVALKVLPSHISQNKDAVERFHREVVAAAKLTHGNIVTAYDADEADKVHFLVMELVEGIDLSKLVYAKGTLSVAKAVDYVIQAAQGLQYAHENGLIHRDIKPSNLLFEKTGTVKILDMGLARLERDLHESTAAESLTQSGQVMGTLDYMVPEQATDTHHADARSDIYSLGCTLYFLLTGQIVYSGQSMATKILAHREEPIPSLRDQREDVSEALNSVFQRMLAKEPADRQQSMAEVIRELEACRDDEQGLLETTSASSDSTSGDSSIEHGDSDRDMTVAPAPPQPGSDSGSQDTDAWLQEEPSGLPTVFRPVEKTKGKRAKPPWIIIGAAMAGLAFLLGIMFVVQTPEGTIVVEVSEPDAMIQVLTEEGRVEIQQSSGEEPVTIEVAPGRKELRVEKAGFELFTKEFTLASGDREPITARLIPKETTPQSMLVVVIAIPGAEIYVDGRKVVAVTAGDAKPIEIPVEEGDHDLRIVKDGKELLARSVSVAEGVREVVDVAEPEGTIGKGDGAYTLQLNGLGGLESLSPTKLTVAGVDALGDTKPSDGVRREFGFEEVAGDIVIEYPQVPASAYVVEFDFTVHSSPVPAPDWIFKFYLANPFPGAMFSIHAPRLGEAWGRLVRKQFGLSIGRGGWPCTLDRSVKCTLYVNENRQSVFEDGTRVLVQSAPSADLWPTVLRRKDARFTLRRFACRPWADEDSSITHWPIPQFVVKEDLTLTSRRIARKSGLANAPDPANPNNFAAPSTGIPLVWIKPGSFDRANSEKVGGKTKVIVTRGFWIGRYELTQKEWSGLMPENPSRVTGSPYLPIDGVSWDDAIDFCHVLNERERSSGQLPKGYEYRLPTEAEWEYACRAGRRDDFSVPLDGFWHDANSGWRLHEVGEGKPNAWGLYDMHGNAPEWCLDGFIEPLSFDTGEVADPFVPASPRGFVLRGGGWFSQADGPSFDNCTSSGRNGFLSHRGGHRSFRIVLGPVVDVPSKEVGAELTMQHDTGPNADWNRTIAEKVLAAGGHLQIQLGKRRMTINAELPDEPFAVTWISLRDKGRDFDPSILAGIENLKSLETLDLVRTWLKGDDLASIVRVTCLKELIFHGGEIRDEDIAQLSSLINLEQLEFACSELTDAGLRTCFEIQF